MTETQFVQHLIRNVTSPLVTEVVIVLSLPVLALVAAWKIRLALRNNSASVAVILPGIGGAVLAAGVVAHWWSQARTVVNDWDFALILAGFALINIPRVLSIVSVHKQRTTTKETRKRGGKG
jgi:hypothetical protein